MTFIAISCERTPPSNIRTEDNIVASVGNRILYESDLHQIIHQGTSANDSIALATAYIDQWVRDQLMTREAARFFASDFEIEQLVDDYREKLLKFNLEEKIVNMRFDTTISQSELINFYNEMKEQFLLNENIFRCIYAKFDRKTNGLETFRKYWQEENDREIRSFVNKFSVESQLDSMHWLTFPHINRWYNKWSINRINKEQKQGQLDAEYEYFLKIIEKEDIGSISPLDYIRPQLTRMLLHKRKQNILEKYKQELYESALNNNLVKLP